MGANLPLEWLGALGVKTAYIEPGPPWEKRDTMKASMISSEMSFYMERYFMKLKSL